MKEGVLCVLTTYKRNNKVLRFLGQFKDGFEEFKDFFRIHIVDDDPNSTLSELIDKNYSIDVKYHKNDINLGQGPNAISHLKKNIDYEYIWIPGDDDLIVKDQFLEVLGALRDIKPTAAVLEFRQGKNLQAGTFFGGNPRCEKNLDKTIELLNRFGKCTSSVFRNPGEEFLEFLCEEMKYSMYQDKAMGLYSILQSYPNQNVYVHPVLTATGDQEFGLLRYSTRVFANLTLTSKKVLQFFNKETNRSLDVGHTKDRGALYWWFFGVKSTLRGKSEIKYEKNKLIRELLYGWLLAIYYKLRGEFQRP